MATAAAKTPKKDNKPKLFEFTWEGVDRRGNRVKGDIRSTNAASAKAELRKQGVNPHKVKKRAQPLFQGGGKVLPKDISIFMRQLATMMAAGVPLVQSFEIVGRGHENPAMQDLIMGVKADIEGGGSLAEAFAKRPLYFDDLVCNLVNAGEQAGILEGLLDKIATYKEKTEAIKGKIKKALFYPTAVVVVAFIVTAILLIFVVPQFAALFANFGADLPAFTQLVLDMSNGLQKHGLLVGGALIAAGYAFKEAKLRSRKFRHFLDLLALKMPVMGEILRKAAIARFARTLSTMFAAGVPLVDAMTSVAGATGNILYQEGTLRIRDDISTGQQLQAAMRQTNLFPNMVVQMVAIGEESGSIDAMLSKVADFYEEEVDNAIDALSSLLEPMIMAFLGVVVGGLVIAMYLPIFKMGEVV